LNQLDRLKQSGNWTVGVIPSVVLNFLKSDSDTRVIAKPQLRVSEGEQAEILIGDRVPIPTTTFNTGQTVGGNIVPITSFTYQNVGITVQIEPRVHHNKEVTLKVQVEVSQLGPTVSFGRGETQPTISARQMQTVIRLRDGETNMLAGLIAREDKDSFSGVVGLSDIPGLRRVFGKSEISTRETDIIMTLTPRIIRIPDITEEDLATLWVGTEENMRLRGPARNSLAQGPFGAADEALASTEPGPRTPLGRTSGTLARITPSAEVERDRAAAPPEPARPAEEAPEAAAPPVQPPIPAVQPPEGEPEEVAPEEEDDGGEEPAEPPAGPAMIRLVPSQPSYRVGDSIVVQVQAENANNVGSVPFHLRYNPAVLEYVAGEKGPFMESDGTEAVFLATDAGGGGEVVVGLSRLGGPAGVSGSGVLALFQFTAAGPGDAGFAFTGASVKDPQARNVPSAFGVEPVRVEP
jgi:general secretion pathway protein D